MFTLTDDIAALIRALGLRGQCSSPTTGAARWRGSFAHRYSHLVRRFAVVNCPHPRTLVRAVLPLRGLPDHPHPWVPIFEIPWLPELFLSTALGRWLLKLSFTIREGQKGKMDVALVEELVARFQRPADVHGPIQYYREMVSTQIWPSKRARLEAVYRTPITAPATLVWAAKDGALSARVAMNSELDAGCPVDLRPLPGVGHFVSLEAPDKLTQKIRRLLGPLPDQRTGPERAAATARRRPDEAPGQPDMSPSGGRAPRRGDARWRPGRSPSRSSAARRDP